MRTLGNIIWFWLAGLWLALAYVIAGVIACVFIVTIPFGLQSFKLAGYVLWPFGRTVVRKPTAGVASGLANIVWFVVAGWWLALTHLVTGLLLAITVIGLPLAVANIKLVPLAFAPFGKQVVKASTVTTTDATAVSVPQIG